ncbi:hypothetical protein [Bacillus sp. Marseille-Q1617]|uniref:hypothetical protein n=1 Tax=Bacillus sp. Marseille-Q1617 TaxID=2736887 RepID=UPI00158A46A8|nr:hypothetical protein [Bacillus sp. Marseille-Q1617]
MNNFQWLTSLINTRNLMQLTGFMRKRRKNRGTLLWSLIGAAVMGAVFAITRGRMSASTFGPLKSFANNMQHKFQQPNRPYAAGMTEFADELLPQVTSKMHPTNATREHDQTSPPFKSDQTLGE